MMGLVFSFCLITAGHATEWNEALRERAREIRLEAPEIAVRVDGMRPIRNRAGAWFFPGDDLTQPAAQALIQDRVLSRRDQPEVRVALVYALDSEHRFSWSSIRTEEPSVQVAMLHGYKGLDTDKATQVLSAALESASASVRAEAARLVGYRKETGGLDAFLMVGLQDASEEVRRLSARSLGWLEVQDAFLPLSRILDDANPSVRVAVVRALAKIDADRVRTLPQFQALAQDPDPGVQRAVSRVRSR